MASSQGKACRELEGKVTAYLDGALPPSERARLEAHCRTCPTCGSQLAEWQDLVASLGRLEDRSRKAPPPEKDRLLHLFREHGLHRPERPGPCVPLGPNGVLAAPGDHMVYFWETGQEFETAAQFVSTGAARGETSVLLGHTDASKRIEAAIGRAGLDVAGLQRQELLRFVAGGNTSRKLLEEVKEQIFGAVDRGSPLVRVLGNLGWGRPGWPDDREILRLEALVTDEVRKLPVVVMCAYPVHGVDGRTLFRAGVECHPLEYRRNALRTNELYVPAGPFLAALDGDAPEE